MGDPDQVGRVRPMVAVGLAEGQIIAVVAEDGPAPPFDLHGPSQPKQSGRVEHERQPRLGWQVGQALLEVAI